ncbi:MAG: bacillithiol system redox-active protein YtxJ [Bacteroidetes bacterium]|nr:bacillithiol system redox-active protein YtxJ [Bacteroidota bacterium]
MNWIEIDNLNHLKMLHGESITDSQKSTIIFKHSTRCSVSRMALRMIESEWSNQEPIYLVNVVENRPVSNQIAMQYNIQHESPQLLVVKNGACIYDASHSAIDIEVVKELIQSAPN